MENKFILFSLARSGSTTLSHILNCHPDIKCINEPFNPNNFGGRYSRPITDLRSLDDTLVEIWRRFNGIKHVWHESGWPFAERQHFNIHILLKASSHVLLLNRKNILQRVVSSQVSEQTKVWSFVGDCEREKVRSFKFKPLDVEWLKRQLEFESEATAEKKRMLDSAGLDYLELWYEDLYDASRGWQKQLNTINEVVSFLGGVPAESEEQLGMIRELLNPTTTKLNSCDTYRRIPGIQEIEERFGSDDTGWLFK